MARLTIVTTMLARLTMRWRHAGARTWMCRQRRPASCALGPQPLPLPLISAPDFLSLSILSYPQPPLSFSHLFREMDFAMYIHHTPTRLNPLPLCTYRLLYTSFGTMFALNSSYHSVKNQGHEKKPKRIYRFRKVRFIDNCSFIGITDWNYTHDRSVFFFCHQFIG